MLRVGLTGELGSGKSTVARMLAQHGAVILSSDEMGRAMMQPGHAAFDQIVEHFGTSVLNDDGTLNRHALAKLAFDPHAPRVEELNAIIHPAVITAQAEQIAELARTQPHAIVVIESALIFSTKHAPGRGWRDRFDCILLVTAPDDIKIDRFIQRTSPGAAELPQLREDARRRLQAQRASIPDQIPTYRLENDGTLIELTQRVDALWSELQQLEARTRTLA
ncbi:MAG TPA: dephospho-CoA kinase [Acidobacteriaceae bacterium]|nr:dephospho-CoA kinase [Acidobacteriaceae bacterium]